MWKRGEKMVKEEKEIAKKVAEAAKMLSPAKREYLIGFAEGIAAANESRKENGDKPASWKKVNDNAHQKNPLAIIGRRTDQQIGTNSKDTVNRRFPARCQCSGFGLENVQLYPA